MRTRIPIAALIAAGPVAALLAAPLLALAAREQVDTIPLGLTPNLLQATDDGGFVLATSGSSQEIVVLDTRSFDPLDTTLTLGSATAAVQSIAEGGQLASPEVIVGTDDGYVQSFLVEDLALMADDGVTAGSAIVFRVEDGSFDVVSAVELNPLGTLVYAGNRPDETIQVFDREGMALSGPILLFHQPDGAVYASIGLANRIFFGSDDGTVPWIDADAFTVGTPIVVEVTGTHRILKPAVVTAPGNVVQLAVADATDGILYLYDPSGLVLLDQVALAGTPVDVAVSGEGAETVIWVAQTNPNQVDAFDENLAAVQTAIPLGAAPRSLAESDGYLFAGLASGAVSVITDRPWIEIQSVTPDPLTDAGQDLQVTFTSTQGGTGRVEIAGATVETVPVVAGSANTVTLTAGGFAVSEGTNRLRVEVTGTATGLEGHDETSFAFDVPPNAPRDFRVGFGDGRVIGRWDAPSDTVDLAGYRVSFGTDPSATGGAPGQASPAETDATTYTVQVSNGTTVWMYVQAVDSAGTLSAATTIESATAQPTFGAADAANDEGGFLFCAVAAVPPGDGGARAAAASLLAIAALAFSLARRRAQNPARRNGVPDGVRS